jgi:CO/xanthine dehydrogenase FAD-binding subunit
MKLVRPLTFVDAVAQLHRDPEGTRVFSGGIEIGFALRRGSISAAVLLDVKRLPDITGIAATTGEVRIAPATRHHTISVDHTIRAQLPSLALACASVGSTRIRMQGTLGGNFGHGHQHTDPGAAAVALGGHVDLMGPNGARSVPVDRFWLGPYTVARRPDELITGIRLTPLGDGWTVVHDRVEQLHRPPDAVVSLGARLEDGVVADVRMGAGGVPMRPTRLTGVEDVIRGQRLAALRGVWNDVEKELAADVAPEDDLLGSAEFKLALLSGLVRRAFSRLAAVRDPARHPWPDVELLG